MKAAILATTAALLLLGGCKKPPQGESEFGASVASNAVAEKLDAVKLEPGEWEATQEILDVRLSGLPQGVPADAATRMIGQRTTFKHCVTPEQAAKPSADFLAAQKDASCNYADFDMSGGKVKASMTCGIPQQKNASMKIAMDGTYLPDRYDMDMNADTTGLANGMTMTVKMKSTGKRLGECPGGEGSDGADGDSAG